MKISRKFVSVVTGLLSLAAIATTTANATVAVNIGGSSAARNFMGQTPLNLCDANTTNPPVGPFPNYYITADNNRHTWTCTASGLGLSDTSVIFRYVATASADGILKLQVPTGDPASIMQFFDLTGTLGCSGPTVTTRASDGRNYNLFTGCSNTNITPTTGPGALPLHMGAADVAGSSFGQVGPAGFSQPQLDDSTLNVTQTAILPFSIFVGAGVVRVDSSGKSAGPLTSLTRLELEQIFARGVTDWQRLGYGTVPVGSAVGTTIDATSPIVLCLRNSGSGTKATLDQTIMINTSETPGAIPNANVIFSSGTGGVVTCLANNARSSIGYMDSDQESNFLPGGTSVGLAAAVRVDGTLAHDPSLTDTRRDLKCGRYSYWTNERLNRRTTSEGANIDALMAAFIQDASTSASIALLPVGAYWLAPSDMFVSKNADLGPINWKSGNHPGCR